MAFTDFIKKVMYGPGEGEEFMDDTNEDFDEGFEGEGRDTASSGKTTEDEAVSSSGTNSGSTVNMTSGSAIEMKVIKPDTLDSASKIADCLLDRKTVLLNLENTSKETARRLIDFLNGVAYAINGDLQKVATDTYVVTPNNVEVTGDPVRETSDNTSIG